MKYEYLPGIDTGCQKGLTQCIFKRHMMTVSNTLKVSGVERHVIVSIPVCYSTYLASVVKYVLSAYEYINHYLCLIPRS